MAHDKNRTPCDCESLPVRVTDIYGENVFNEVAMSKWLPKDIFKKLKSTIDNNEALDPKIADAVANAMKDWAIEKGATHFTHWFQPLTGVTAEKHDSFVSPQPNGQSILEFSGKELIKGEPDASSFPSGGLRATFEARGYTQWDCTSPAFVKEDGTGVTLYIPTAFYSYNGEALDKKTPLLRSMEAISTQGLRILRALGNTTSRRVIATVGAEQEYFLIDREYYEMRLDLKSCGRTLFGAAAPKGHELDDHYFGAIRERISSFMRELNIRLWRLGVPARTEHNEVAPAQFELAPMFSTTNIATDQNQLIMETMKKVALRHDLICLLHEKPFAGINGSGKHNNWSIATDDGVNLLNPGDTPQDNIIFLVFLISVITAVNKYADVLRATTATHGNDHRLGANEAPPAIVSVFTGTALTALLDALEQGNHDGAGKTDGIDVGVQTLPVLPKDSTDRNRTSSFAFTGNKFEFRMVGSSQSIADANTVLNTMVADVLQEVADSLEKAGDPNAVRALLQTMIKENKKVIFNGNNYSDEWVAEAARRGLPNLTNAVDAIAALHKPETIALFKRQKVLTEIELESRYEVMLENYISSLRIEANTMISIGNRQLLPAAVYYSKNLADAVTALKNVGADSTAQQVVLKRVTTHLTDLQSGLDTLQSVVEKESFDSTKNHAEYVRDTIVPAMNTVRAAADNLEMIVDEQYWPLPTYADMLLGE